ncbi:MAG TPA: hypothetical protein VFI96_02535, partial [Longimicrobiaceae bacterium]|nr:hypothetical protein [Longimicrobiaceae bacterium]
MSEHAKAPSRRPVRRAFLGAALLSGALIAACEGTNAWKDIPTGPSGNGSADQTAPSVEILVPDSAARVAIGDSAYLQVRVRDDEALDSLFLSGAALRGDPELGTRDTVARFLTRSIGFTRDSAVVDTTLTRWLLATADTADNETVYLVATALDAAGNVATDTVRITIGGPRLNLNQPLAGSQIRAGTRLAVRLSAVDRGGTIRSLSVRGTASGYDQTATLALEPALPKTDTVLHLDIPSSVRGDLTLRATLRTVSNDSAATAPVVVTVI